MSLRQPHDPRCTITACTALFLAFLSQSAFAGEPSAPDSSRDKGVLIDSVHANGYLLLGLKPGIHSYHQIYAFNRGFDYLRSRRVAQEHFLEGRLNAERLAKHRLLFINLVSAERPPFLVSEINAIKAFVAGGGSLLVITDHTNAYFHAYRLKPLFEELGLETFTCTACDVPPRLLSGGNGWIAIERFVEHPVTFGLKCIAFQTGGCVDPRWAVALTSKDSWADEWVTGIYGEENAMGFCGNFRRDPDEKQGPLGVVLAKPFGKGKIAVVGDQNIFGDPFINYADNYRLWLNLMAWLLGDQNLGRPEPYLASRRPRLLFYEQYHQSAFANNTDDPGYYRAFVFLSRHFWAFANDRLTEPCDLLILARNSATLAPESVAAIAAHLRRGKNVLILESDEKGLENPGGAIAAIGKVLGAAPTGKQTKDGAQVLAFAGAGQIHVLPKDAAVNNAWMPTPEQAPNDEQRRREQRLLESVREALGPAAASPAPKTGE